MNLGGGIANYCNGIITLAYCTVTENKTADQGGGIFNVAANGGVIKLTNCTASGNSAAEGGGIYNDNEGSNNTITLTNCTFSNNSATAGAGIEEYGDATIVNSAFIGNVSGSFGGGLEALRGASQITNCTFFANMSGIGGDAISAIFDSGTLSGSATVRNCILWDLTGSEEIAESSMAVSVDHSDVYRNSIEAGPGNINSDPLFINAATGDLHLKPSSPCLGAGTSIGAPATDLDGKVRPSLPSMGVYEYAAAPSTAVLLVHGTFSSAQVWNGGMSQFLTAHGFTVEAVDFPTEPETRSNETYIEFQAQAIQRRVYELMARSGQRSVSLVCHSMGGLAARYYLEHPELQPKDSAGLPYSGVSKLIMLGTPNWGTDAPLLDPVSTVSLAHYATLPKLANGESGARDQYDNWGPAISEQFAEWEPAPEAGRAGSYYYPIGEKLYSWPLNGGSFYSPIQAQSYLFETFVSDTVTIFGNDYNAETAVLRKFPESRRQRNAVHLAYYPQAAQRLGEDYPSSQGVHGVNKRLVSRFLADLNFAPYVPGVAYYLVAGTEPVAEKFQPISPLFSFSLITVPGPFAEGIQNDGVVPTDSELGVDPLTGNSMFPDASDLVLDTYHLDLPNNPEVIEQVTQWLKL